MASFFQKTRRGFWADANSTKSHPRTTDASVRFSTCGFRPAPRRGLHCAIYMLTCLTNARLLLIAMHKRADRRDAHPQRRASPGFTMTNANKHGCRRCAGNDPYTIVASDVYTQLLVHGLPGWGMRPLCYKASCGVTVESLLQDLRLAEDHYVWPTKSWPTKSTVAGQWI